MKKKQEKRPASLDSGGGNTSLPVRRGLARANQGFNNVQSARAYAFLLLKFRLRSEKELLARLRQKGFLDQVSQEAVNFLKDREFIDDRVFAKGWVASRLKRPLGLRKIAQELVQKGLDKSVIQDALGEIKEGYEEKQVVSELARQKLSRMKGIEPLKAKARIYGYLMRRGFSPDVIGEVIKEL